MSTATVEGAIERLYREEGGRILATLIQLVRDFALAEEVLQDALAQALVAWPLEGVPRAPRAWIVSTARHKAIDILRRRATFLRKQEQLARELAEAESTMVDPADDDGFPDERLRLIFTCCHPGLAEEARVALTLRTLCGLTTDEIARAFLLPPATLAQRLVRAQRKIRDAGIPYRVPAGPELDERLSAVLQVIYLVFTEGYASTAGDALMRHDLCAEAIRLARMVTVLMPGRHEPQALLALLLLHDARRDARVGPDGELVLLEAQDRSRWDRGKIREGLELVEASAGPRGRWFPSAFWLQAAIAAVHAEAARPELTDWRQITALYGALLRVQPSPIVELNRAVALAMAEGPEHGLRVVDGLLSRGALPGYHLLPATRGALLARLGRHLEAADAYRAALALARNGIERAFLQRRIEASMRSV